MFCSYFAIVQSDRFGIQLILYTIVNNVHGQLMTSGDHTMSIENSR